MNMEIFDTRGRGGGGQRPCPSRQIVNRRGKHERTAAYEEITLESSFERSAGRGGGLRATPMSTGGQRNTATYWARFRAMENTNEERSDVLRALREIPIQGTGALRCMVVASADSV